jgi:hypothetical protein
MGWRPAVVLLAAVLAGCAYRQQVDGRAAAATPAPGLYTNTARAAGIDFRHSHGGHGRHYLLETTGAGVAAFDYDGDGHVDIFFLQSGQLPWEGRAARSPAPLNRLYRNRGDGTFQDVTSGSGLEDTGYGQGVAVGDYDGDGWDDLFVTAYGGNRLFRNLAGSGRFADVTAIAGVADLSGGKRWCASAAFGDYDNDGLLDLYVTRYARWSPETDKQCLNPRGEPSYCSPEIYPGEEHLLYRNLGNGKFRDVSAAAGITRHSGHGLGVAWVDYDLDGWEDIFVPNDLSPFFLWRNNRNGTFTNVGEPAGVAYSDMGQLLSGMGVAVADFNGDGLQDLFVTNFSGQMNALFRNEKGGVFTNVTVPSGIGPASFMRLGFGCEFVDFDRDGLADLLVGNGHVNEDVGAYSQGIEYAQPKSLLRNNGNGTFKDVLEGLGDLAVPHVTRGLAVADFNGDGHLDAVTVNQNGPAELLMYTGPDTGAWISVRTRGKGRGGSNANGYHARITVRAGGRTQVKEVRSGSSYASHSDAAAYFGLGNVARVDELRIDWHASRTVTVARNVEAGRGYLAREGGALQPVVARALGGPR